MDHDVIEANTGPDEGIPVTLQWGGELKTGWLEALEKMKTPLYSVGSFDNSTGDAMPLKADHSNLPAKPDVGVEPDPQARWAPMLAAAWAETVDRSEREMAVPGSRIRHSWAGICARALQYRIQGAEETNPSDVADFWRFGIGQAIHEMFQEVIAKAFPGAEVEVKVTIDEIGSSGHIDLVIAESNTSSGEVKPHRVAVELKSINGYGFKRAIGARGPAEGPRWSALVQGALNAKAIDADELVIIYLSLENLSPRELSKLVGDDGQQWQRFAAEWTWSPAEFLPIADAEIARMGKVLALVDAGTQVPRAIPDPEIPKGARVVDPHKGRWMKVNEEGAVVGSGDTWHCAYCSFRDRCASDGG